MISAEVLGSDTEEASIEGLEALRVESLPCFLVRERSVSRTREVFRRKDPKRRAPLPFFSGSGVEAIGGAEFSRSELQSSVRVPSGSDCSKEFFARDSLFRDKPEDLRPSALVRAIGG